VNISKEGSDLLKAIEQLRYKTYDDQTGDDIDSWVHGATIGYGHLIDKSEWSVYAGRTISEDEANDIFISDLVPFEIAVSVLCPQYLRPHQFDALVILAFNIGIRGFTDSSVRKMVNDRNASVAYSSLTAAWSAWNKSQGQIMQGLINRRNAEMNIWDFGKYERW